MAGRKQNLPLVDIKVKKREENEDRVLRIYINSLFSALHEFGNKIGGSQEKTSEQESQRQYELVHCLASKADLIVLAAGGLLLSFHAKAQCQKRSVWLLLPYWSKVLFPPLSFHEFHLQALSSGFQSWLKI